MKKNSYSNKPTLYDRLVRNKFLTTVLLLLPIVYFIGYLAVYALNIPYLDDYRTFLTLPLDFQEATTLKEKWWVLIRRENYDHHLVINKLVGSLTLWLTGKINFKLLTFLGNISLLGIAYLFYRNSRQAILLFVPVLFIFFTAEHYQDTILYATCSLQHGPTILLVLLGFQLILANRKTSYFLLGILAGTIACFTSSNGLIFYPLVVVGLLLQKRFKEVAFFIILSTLPVYEFITTTSPEGSITSLITSHTFERFLTYFVFVGNFTAFISSFVIAQNTKIALLTAGLAGFVITVLAAFLFIKNLRRLFVEKDAKLLVLFLNLASLISIAFIGSFARPFVGIDFGLSERYFIYTVTLFVNLYAIFIATYPQTNKKFFVLATSLSVVFAFMAHFYYTPAVLYAQRTMFADVMNYQFTKQQLLTAYKNDPDAWKREFDSGIYTYPKQYVNRMITNIADAHKTIQLSEAFSQQRTSNDITERAMNEDHVYKLSVHCQDYNEYFDANKNETYLILYDKATNYCYAVPSMLLVHPIRSVLSMKQRYVYGAQNYILYQKLAKGNYHVGYLTVTEPKNKIIQWTTDFIEKP